MKHEKQAKKEKYDSKKQKEIKYFHTIEDFPKFKILEENYQGILEELLTVINKEKQNNLKEKIIDKNLNALSNEINDKEDFSFSNNQDNKNTVTGNIPNNLNANNINYKNNKEHSDYKKNLINYTYANKIKNSNTNNKNLNKDKANNGIEKGEYNTKTFEPWVEKNLYQESNEEGWDVAPLMIGGERIPERWERFPFLASLASQISGVVSVSFSLLKPGTHIVPHKGYDDYSEKMYRFHMGLIVPQGDIAIRVEKEIRKWENAKSFVFDDFMIHEAWNFTPKNRIVLIIDFLKDETKIPQGIKFFDSNFNKSIEGYLKKSVSSSDKNDFQKSDNESEDN